MTPKEVEIVDWLVNNKTKVDEILYDMNNAKSKLMEMEPVVFHEDIEKEFYDLAIQKITDLITKNLAISAEVVYNVLENKKLVVDSLNKDLQ